MSQITFSVLTVKPRRMKQLLALMLLSCFSFTLVAADGLNTPIASTSMQGSQKVGDLKQLLGEMWGKLRSYVPRSNLGRAENSQTQIAGVRGDESTTSQLEPYWKGDKSDDPAYTKEIGALGKAIKLADEGKLKAAAKAFDAFLKTYPDSSLKPNAQFGLGLAYGGLGQKNQSIAALQGFAAAYPQHPLANDAQKMIQQFKRP